VNNAPGGGEPGSSLPTIDSELTAKGVSFKMYGSTLSSVNASQLDTDIATNALPAVSFVHPEAADDGHPAYSTLPALENYVMKMANEVINNGSLFANTAIVITTDESGGYYDFGILPTDGLFWGWAPRPSDRHLSYAKQGYVDNYYDHASILKFIDENWGLSPLTTRSRDNLPNPVASSGNLYVPTNAPAIGDLMNMFDFTHFRSNAPPIQ
jgi:hypothetical protein